MPCVTRGYSESELCQMANDKGNLYGKQFEAVLCGVFTDLDKSPSILNKFLKNIDWVEVGAPMELVESW